MLFVDTNVLLNHLDSVKNEELFLLSSESLRELENIKTSRNKTEEIRYAARKAVRYLDESPDRYKVIVYDMLSKCDFLEYGLEDTPDNRILRCAEYARDVLGYKDLVFMSDDILARLIGKEYFSLDVMGVVSENDGIYKGYKLIKGNSERINQELSDMDYSKWNTNEYLIIENTDDGSIKEMRFDGEKFVSLKLPPSKYIKAKNSLQRCALDMVMNPDITIAAILGSYGSGKTCLSMKMACWHVLEKGNQATILGVRSPWGEGREVGWLPGTLEDKTDLFFLPLAQQLDGGEFELSSLRQRGVLQATIPYYMKGNTYNETCILVDEAEDLTEKEIKLVGTRVGQNSRLILNGDIQQSLISTSINNPLVKMCNKLKGNPRFGCIYLEDDVRSETSKIFAELF